MNTDTTASFFLKRKWILVTLFIVTPTGFLFKLYSGPACHWFNDYGAGVMYEIFWCMVIFLFCPCRKAATKIAVGVFFVTGFLEILQLWQPWFLQQARSTFLGGALLGTAFVWWDFPHYVLGCLIGWLLMRAISKKIPQTSMSR
jgi:hypothetical protein